jgi:hypothetical protein
MSPLLSPPIEWGAPCRLGSATEGHSLPDNCLTRTSVQGSGFP